MTSEQSSPNQGGPSPRHSTSIDDVMGQQAAGERVSPTSAGAMLPPPVSPVPPAADAASSVTGGAWQTAAEVNKHKPRKRSFSADAPMWFGFGLLLCLWGGILMFDHYGPTRDLDARITDVDASRGRKGGTSYSIEGVDSQGGEFDTDVSRDIYRSADPGDRVVVSRAWLTSRVVSIDGGGWRHDGGRMIWLFNIATAIGLVLLVCGLVSMRRFAADDESNPGPLRRVRVWLIVGAVLAAGWIVYERSQASGNADGATSSVAPVTEATQAARDSVECTDLGSMAGTLVPSLTARGSVSAAEVGLLIDTVSAIRGECTPASVDRAVCAELTRVVAADPSLIVTTGGRCPGLP